MAREPLSTEELVHVFKALGNPARLEIMRWLQDPDTHFSDYPQSTDRNEAGVCVTFIQARSGLAQSTVSSHLSALERAGLVRQKRAGKWIHYRRDEEQLARLGEFVESLA